MHSNIHDPCCLTACALTACSLTALCSRACCLSVLSPIVCFLTACFCWLTGDRLLTGCLLSDCLFSLRVLSDSLCSKNLIPPTACSFWLVPGTACCPASVPPVCASGSWLSSLRFVWVASLLWLLPDLSSLADALTLFLFSFIPHESLHHSTPLIFLFRTSSFLPGYGLNGPIKPTHALIQNDTFVESGWPHMDRKLKKLKQKIRRWRQQQLCALSDLLSSSH